MSDCLNQNSRIMHCASGLRSFRSHNRVISTHRTNLLDKFLVRSEITSYTWNEMTMKGNNQIPYKPQQALFIRKVNIVIHWRNLLREMDSLFKKKTEIWEIPFFSSCYLSCTLLFVRQVWNTQNPFSSSFNWALSWNWLIYPLGKRMMFLWKSYIFMYSHVSGLSAS